MAVRSTTAHSFASYGFLLAIMVHLSQSEWPAWTYSVAAADDFTQYAQLPDYSLLAESMKAYQQQHTHLVHHQQMTRTTESKPRLSKEEVDLLESEFQKNHKPNSSTKKALAESMRVDHARINVLAPVSLKNKS